MLPFIIDTGAEVSVITQKTLDSIRVSVSKPTKLLVGANGSKLEVSGVVNVELAYKDKRVQTTLYVVVGARCNLLGIVEVKSLDLLRVVRAVSTPKTFDPFAEFPSLFVGLGVMPGVFKIDLKPGYKPFQLYTPRTIQAGLREKARNELLTMQRDGIIEPVNQATEWCSGLTIVPKPDGRIRMCVDLSRLNQAVRRELYPLPKVGELLATLSSASVFSKLDANSGFWQVKLDPESRLLTTFITPWGRFCFRVMPFGISSAPEYFQRAMARILDGLEGVACMMDDVLVYGRSEAEHWSRLRKVLQRVANAGMTLRKDKCEFGVKEVKFLGRFSRLMVTSGNQLSMPLGR